MSATGTNERAIPPGESHDLIEDTLAIARTRLEMDIAWVAEFVGDEKIFRVLEGDSDGWELGEGDSIPGADSYCQRVLDGRLPSVVPDASENEAVRNLEVTRRLGIAGYIGVPLVLSDGRVYGVFCCASRAPAYALGERDVTFMRVLSRVVSRELERLELEHEYRRLEVEKAAIQALLVALDARDGYTGHHSQAVVSLAGRVARRLGLDEAKIVEVEQVALLHDIGKVAVPDGVLHKAGRLNDREWWFISEHPKTAERIIASIESLAHLAPLVRAEHEHWDGSGYPDGLAGEEIPTASRIAFVCDSFHAMTSDRPYRRALDLSSALAEVRRNAGSQFWPEAVEALLADVSDVATTEPADGSTAQRLSQADR